MKIHRWINKYNYKICFEINQKLSRAESAGIENYQFKTTFYGRYAIRLLLVLLSILSLKKSTFRTLWQLIASSNSAFFSQDNNSVLFIKVREFLYTLFGFRYFVSPTTLPLLSQHEIIKHKRLEFHLNNSPSVSIIIPVHNHLDFTYNCLSALRINIPEDYNYEILIIDDCSEDSTEIFFKNNVNGIKYIRNNENIGFLASCNKASEAAHGQYLCFLNNDTQIMPGWIESLVDTFQDSSVGCAGSKLIYANGLLQEAGGVIYHDASGCNYGRYDNKDRPKYNFIREVDYCSGASLIIRKADFALLGGFDCRFSPAYYEDTDLCFAVKYILKKRVIYQPKSSLIHFEGTSSGNKQEEGTVKNHQFSNQPKFLNKWKEVLARRPANNNCNDEAKRWIPEKKLLFIDATLPAYDKDSGSLRVFELLKVIKSLNIHIIFVPDDGEKAEPYFEQLQKSGVEILYRFPNRKGMISELKALLPEISFAWICRPELNLQYADLIRQHRAIKRIYDTVDLHHIRISREAKLTNNQELEALALQIKETELAIARSSDYTLTVTEEEKSVLDQNGIENVKVIPNIHRPVDRNIPAFGDRAGIIFIGGYLHPPNIDAAKWLTKEIMPLVWGRAPIHLTLLGSNPTKEILDLANENVTVTGFVPDVSDFFLNSRIFVAPLRFGAGMKGKIGQSLSYSLPVITTDVGAEGIGLVHQENALIANTEETFAQYILQLYYGKNLWEKLSSNSSEPLQMFSPEIIQKRLQMIFG